MTIVDKNGSIAKIKKEEMIYKLLLGYLMPKFD